MDEENLHNPFRSLQKKHYAKARSRVQASPPVKQNQEMDPIDENALFLNAMSSVERVPTPQQQKTYSSGDEDFAALFAASLHNKTAPVKKSPSPTPLELTTFQTPHPAKTAHVTPSLVDTADSALFVNAMSGIAPVKARGRDLPPPPPPQKEIIIQTENALEDLISGKVEFTLALTEEYLEGHVKDLDSSVIGMLKAGSYSIEAHLDLHGQNIEQAYTSLSRFIKESYHNNKRHLLLVTGRGKNSPGGTAVIRERVQTWLTRDPFKRVVLAFCTAKARDGGAGALYLLLRKRKKSQGKIIWDRMLSEDELLS